MKRTYQRGEMYYADLVVALAPNKRGAAQLLSYRTMSATNIVLRSL